MDSNEALENVQYIKNMLTQTRTDSLDRNVGQMIVWGILVTISCYIRAYLNFVHLIDYQVAVWVICFVIGISYSVYDSRKYYKKIKVLNTISKMFATLWYASYVVFILVCFVPVLIGKIPVNDISVPIISFILAINYTVVAVAFQIKPVYVSSAVFYLCGILSYFIPFELFDLMFGTAMLIGQVLPSLYLKYSNEEFH